MERMLLTPRDWQVIAQREACELLGTPEGAAKLAEAKRYGALADEIERQIVVIRSVNSRCDHLGIRLGEVIRERDALKAAQELKHTYKGECPDETQPESRDPGCAACRMLMKLEGGDGR